jgi:formylglycine-generating enzyme required for sulfatase activity
LLIVFQSSYSQNILKIHDKTTDFVSIEKTNIYANKFEVSNSEYLQFLSWIKKNKGETEYANYLPDTLVWRSPLGYMEKYVNYYLRHPAFRNYPVVGITYEQANAYCKWLTETQNSILNDEQIQKIVFRLPSEDEWELAASGGFSEGVIFPWGTKSVRIGKGKYTGAHQANYSENYSENIFSAGLINDGGNITTSKKTYLQNGYGFYQIAGNVAEMVTEKSICKGGAWCKPSYKMVISDRDTMDEAENWVGFRVFAEVEEYKIEKTREKFDARFFEKQLVQIPFGGVQAFGYKYMFHDTTDFIIAGGFYISAFEVSNELYKEFLNSIKDSMKRLAFGPKDENWISETELLQYQHYTTQFPNHPVVNIDKKAMIEFCNWLTNIYNNDTKRNFKEVRFSLPSVKEQIVVSQCGLNLLNYSWGGPYNCDSKGNYLMNFNPLSDYLKYNEKKLTSDLNYRHTQLTDLKKSRALDGFELTAPVDSYEPCKYGIYNLNGNVAEAVSNSDFVFGGSFASMALNCTNLGINDSILEKIELPSPQVGFRFVMEVIKE